MCIFDVDFGHYGALFLGDDGVVWLYQQRSMPHVQAPTKNMFSEIPIVISIYYPCMYLLYSDVCKTKD